MPITYEHRVPAATLGGLALAAGQEQYAAKRGQEERERAMKLAQMAQQQQMQNQRLAYGAASTQYRTAADYNKFIMGAQIDAQGRQRDQNNRLALMDHGDELAAGREEARWDRAGEQAGQQDTFGAWKEYVTSTLPSLNQDGRDILNTHAGKVRSIMANQNFNRTQKSSAVSMVLEEVQGLGLDQNYALEQMYEAGKTYKKETGEVMLWDGQKEHLQGRHYDGLIKPDIMPEAEWMRTGRNEAWMDKHTSFMTRDEDGKRVRHFISGGKWEQIVDEDDLYKAQEQKREDDAMRKEDQATHAAWVKDRSAFIDSYLDRMDIDMGKIGTMEDPATEGPLNTDQRIAEKKRRLEVAKIEADEIHPEPSRGAPPGDFDARGGQFSPGGAMGGEIDLPTGPDPGPMGMGGQPPPGAASDQQGMWASETAGKLFQPPPGDAPPEVFDAKGGQFSTTVGIMKEVQGMVDDPQMKALMGQGIDIVNAVAGGAPPTEEMKKTLRNAKAVMENQMAQTKRATEQGKPVEEGDQGRFRQQAVRQQHGLNVGREDPSSGVRGEREPKVPFERTDEQIAAELALRKGRTTSLEEPYRPPPPPLDPYFSPDTPSPKTYPKGEGQVGFMGGETAPTGVSAQAEKLRKLRGEEPYSEEELKDIAKREYSKPGREVSKEEKLQDRVEDPKTAEKTLFTELWPETERVEHGGEMLILRPPKTKVDRIYDALDEWDLHTPRMTKEKFQKSIHDDEGLRSEYLTRLKTKLTIKEGRSGQESARAKQARFEKRYRAEGKK